VFVCFKQTQDNKQVLRICIVMSPRILQFLTRSLDQHIGIQLSLIINIEFHTKFNSEHFSRAMSFERNTLNKTFGIQFRHLVFVKLQVQPYNRTIKFHACALCALPVPP